MRRWILNLGSLSRRPLAEPNPRVPCLSNVLFLLLCLEHVRHFYVLSNRPTTMLEEMQTNESDVPIFFYNRTIHPQKECELQSVEFV